MPGTPVYRIAPQFVPVGTIFTAPGFACRARVVAHSVVPATASYGNANGDKFDLFVELLTPAGRVSGRISFRVTISQAQAMAGLR
jgi:hypothetical protein